MDDASPFGPPASVEEFRARLTAQADEMPRRLRQCADFIAAHSDRIAVSTVAELAAGADVPPSALMRYRGVPAIGLAVGMRAGGNIIAFGEGMDALMAQVQVDLPLGVEMHLVSDQPRVVEDSVSHFVRALIEAVLIVLAVSFI